MKVEKFHKFDVNFNSELKSLGEKIDSKTFKFIFIDVIPM